MISMPYPQSKHQRRTACAPAVVAYVIREEADANWLEDGDWATCYVARDVITGRKLGEALFRATLAETVAAAHPHARQVPG